MKKTLLTVVAVAMIISLVQAHDLSETLCKDETFVLLVEEHLDLTSHARLLTKDELASFRSSEAFRCQVESIIDKVVYLQKRYKLSGNSKADEIVINQAVKKVLAKAKREANPGDCMVIYMAWISACGDINPNDVSAKMDCYNAAGDFLIMCTGSVMYN
jgi:hypothetical protein